MSQLLTGLMEEAQELVLAQMQDPIRRTFYLFLMKQGCRPGEARALRWGNLDLKNGIAHHLRRI